jgi:hypothetical protein
LTNSWSVPELGPSLGRLTDPAASGHRSPLGLIYDDIRLDLVTGIFEVAAAGRSLAAAGDGDGAMTVLGRATWLSLWERAVSTAAARIGTAANSHLRAAASESRFPNRRLRGLLLMPADVRAIGARLGSGGAAFVSALDSLDHSVHSAAESGGGDGVRMDAWVAALEAAARRVESAWLDLLAAAQLEEQHWWNEADRIRGWRRQGWLPWLVTAIVLGAAIYLGSILGGYLPVPDRLRGFAEYWWSRF